MDTHPLISYKNVSIAFGKKSVLTDISFDLGKSEKIAVTGPSGCGKSTLLKAALGFVPFSGKIFVHDVEVTPHSIDAVRGSLGYIFQEPVLGADTVEDALYLPFTLKAHHSKMPDKDRLHALLDEFLLPPDILRHKAKDLSGGEKQRLALIRSLLIGHDLLLVDEITAALDALTRRKVVEHLLLPRYTLLTIAHDEQFVRQCNATLEIQAGTARLAASGAPA
ncbi:MAG: ATP-binding cassette domain-containing protein [Chitinivibrionales bacterium]|nr:ATP-binding cassette domain-containing protein [Chitinivibrionales bacterium]